MANDSSECEEKTYLRVHSFYDEQVRNGWRGRRIKERESEKRNKKTNDELAPGQGKNGWMQRSKRRLSRLNSHSTHKVLPAPAVVERHIECTIYL